MTDQKLSAEFEIAHMQDLKKFQLKHNGAAVTSIK